MKRYLTLGLGALLTFSSFVATQECDKLCKKACLSDGLGESCVESCGCETLSNGVTNQFAEQ